MLTERFKDVFAEGFEVGDEHGILRIVRIKGVVDVVLAGSTASGELTQFEVRG